LSGGQGQKEETRIAASSSLFSHQLVPLLLFLLTFRVVVVVLEVGVFGVDLLVRVLETVVCVGAWGGGERERESSEKERKKMRSEPLIDLRCPLASFPRSRSRLLLLLFYHKPSPSMSSSDMMGDALVVSQEEKKEERKEEQERVSVERERTKKRK